MQYDWIILECIMCIVKKTLRRDEFFFLFLSCILFCIIVITLYYYNTRGAFSRLFISTSSRCCGAPRSEFLFPLPYQYPLTRGFWLPILPVHIILYNEYNIFLRGNAWKTAAIIDFTCNILTHDREPPHKS